MSNEEIKHLLKVSEIPQWKLAEELGVSEITINRLLRGKEEELPGEKQLEIIEAIDRISKR